MDEQQEGPSENEEFDEMLDFGTRLELEFDPRLADIWLSIFSLELEPEELVKHLGSLLRMAYLRGYDDALKEKVRGELYRRLGVPVPPDPRPQRKRTKGGRR
jgi:hypothetical protein